MITMPAVVFLALGCSYSEEFEIQNLSGTVLLPRAAVTRDIAGADGTVETVTDPRLIGPVYLGLYAGVLGANEVASFPHPEIGPVYRDDTPGDAYPYGGTTVGDMRYPCIEDLACRIVSDRYTSYDDIVNWFNEVIDQPLHDAKGEVIDNGGLIQQTCFDLLEVYTDDEVNLLPSDDNEDGKIDKLDLQFQENADGDFEAEFTIWQQEMFYDQNDTDGDPRAFSLWGFVDMPSTGSYNFSTCNAGTGFGLLLGEYNSEFWSGRVAPDVLNFPSLYITEGDWVASTGFEWSKWDDRPVLAIDFEVP